MFFAGANCLVGHAFRIEMSMRYFRPVADQVHELDARRRDALEARGLAMRAIQETVPSGKIWFWHNDAAYWYDNNPNVVPPRPERPADPLSLYFTILASVHGGWYSQASYAFPAMQPGGLMLGGGRMERGTKLVILSSLPGDALEEARPALRNSVFDAQ